MKNFMLMIFVICLFTGCKKDQKEATTEKKAAIVNDDSTIIKTAEMAYLYGLPLVLMDIARRQSTNAEEVGSMAAPMNQFVHKSTFPDATLKNGTRLNADTYYSSAWLDLSKEPIVLSVPDTYGRYYQLSMQDAYTNIFSSLNKRTTGTGAANFLITGPKSTEPVPIGMQEIKSPTNMVRIINQIQMNSYVDGLKVYKLQRQYKLIPLSGWATDYVAPKGKIDSSVPKGSPSEIVSKIPIGEFFNYVNQLMANNPPRDKDAETVKMFATIGIKPGSKFNLSGFNSSVQSVVRALPDKMLGALNKEITMPPKLENGWTPIDLKLGAFGTDYKHRAMISYKGLEINLPQDIINSSCMVDEGGDKLNGSNKYTIHFNQDEIPLANAFWSLTAYDAKGAFVANPMNRFTIGNRDSLIRNADGSIDIYFQRSYPGKIRENNWLPVSSGEFNIVLRVYSPKEQMLKGKWIIPSIKKTVPIAPVTESVPVTVAVSE
ncbi:DUF1254 domain-containing protein [Flavobacterium sp. 140616W15]|uniref:DUF1254 domain-containing protein n=1 Tax=Flavobacterium sp. 140616W15 TaxID=2478552 RepID=UPI000F0CCE12|nr:DUF1254 domain-containing protein [Flavobacterium sp. 140616W15]AYN04178.1 DUF1254 domain-containing protein [Flavobacterium sp. 140616W15]